ncbi:LamG-like jellyroll fold domain-containing protein [Brumimicrobium mesophilum]|uniref:LamG-like jellyroll fold domain-containing protein n=1 Tax=Brumimicrobium mesophilum TaxID=392717 RepID=UPI000D14067A|nr:LamG-like jellyroll fold domain-containing protein [Brumimicrobium mesophilum]
MKKLNILLMCLLTVTGLKAQNPTALSFDNETDKNYIITGTNAIASDNDRTIEFWTKIDSYYANQRFMVDMGGMGTGTRMSVKLNPLGHAARVEIGGWGLDGVSNIRNNVWHHVAVVYSSTATENFKIYVDGILEASGNPTQTVNTTSNRPITIGIRNDTSLVTSMEGHIDEVRIWDIALSEAEINANMNHEFCTIPPHLIAYYKFNEGIPEGDNTGLNPQVINFADSSTINAMYGFEQYGTNTNWVTGPILNNGIAFEGTAPISTCDYITLNNITYYEDTLFTDTLITAIGCDSILNYEIEIIEIDTTVNVNGNQLAVNQSNATYSWVNCDDNTVVGNSGALNVTSSGSYKVEITINGCTKSSNCHNVEFASINKNYLDNHNFKIVPNPNNGQFKVQLTSQSEIVAYKILNILGKVVFENAVSSKATEINIQANGLTKGTYFIWLDAKEGYAVKKIIVQ